MRITNIIFDVYWIAIDFAYEFWNVLLQFLIMGSFLSNNIIMFGFENARNSFSERRYSIYKFKK